MRVKGRTSSFERGTALMLAIFAFFVISVLIGIGFSIIGGSRDIIRRQLHYRAMGENVAKAGLTEAHSWLRRQDTQPVTVFNPQLDLSDPDDIINDTDDPTIGIVRTFEIGSINSVYGRYEVRKASAAKPYAGDSDFVWWDKGVDSFCEDISDKRMGSFHAGTGTVWRMESVGYIYVRFDENEKFYKAPNKLLASVIMVTEFQRLGLTLGAGAIHMNCDEHVSISNKGIIQATGGGDPGIVWHGAGGCSGNLTTSSGGTLTGTPPQQSSTSPLSFMDIFGVTQDQLKAMADFYVTSASDLPSSLPDLSIVYIEGNPSFSSTNRLYGGGILIVDGNLTLTNNSFSKWSGAVIVTGNLDMGDTAYLDGTVVVMGNNTQVHGTGEVAEINYDEDILNVVKQKIGQYRMTRSPYRIHTHDTSKWFRYPRQR
jgi:hypothetical protein